MSYSLAVGGTVVADSMQYDDGTGTMHSVNSITPSTIKTQTFELPGSIGGTLFVHSTGAGTATFREVWTIDGVAHSDSAIAAISGASHVAIPAPHHSV